MKTSRTSLLLLALLPLVGCRHRQTPVVPTAARAPVALEPVPDAKLPPKVASLPAQKPPLTTVELPRKKVKKVRRKTLADTPPTGAAPGTVQAPAPVQVATATPPPPVAPPIASVIGSLSAGGDASIERKQEAANLITDNEKRLKALSRGTVEGQRDSVMRVRNFDREAMEALKGGDAEGALTLAKKAQVLLDDLEK